MGGRGSSGGGGGGGNGGGGGGLFGKSSRGKGGGAFSVPKLSKAAIGKMSRHELEKVATAIYANNAMKSGISKSEGVHRAQSLMSGNTTAQLRKYVRRYSK